MTDASAQNIGVVVIGRNEGERLRLCLVSVLACARYVIYVDSGSSDGSVELARALGVEVVDLDLSISFTAARARNEGFRGLMSRAPTLSYVQFVDGDCEVAVGWMNSAVTFLEAHPEVAVVCGRRRERFPGHSIYNRLCDIEWETPIGEAHACGGDAMMRVTAFRQVDGYREDLIAGEEPELCLRLRLVGWKVWRLDAEMTRHDAAILSFGQWWRRNVRGGHAFAEGAHRHGHLPERPWVRESASAWFWSAAVPMVMLTAMVTFGWPGLLLAAIYPLQIIRLGMRGCHTGYADWWRAFFLVVGKFPETIGQIQYGLRLLTGGKSRIIEYK